MWKKWGPVICMGIIVLALLAGMWFFLVQIKAETVDRLAILDAKLAAIQSSLAAIGTASDNIAAGVDRMESGLDAYSIGYYASLSGLSSTIGAIMGDYERGLDERVEAIKSGK